MFHAEYSILTEDTTGRVYHQHNFCKLFFPVNAGIFHIYFLMIVEYEYLVKTITNGKKICYKKGKINIKTKNELIGTYLDMRLQLYFQLDNLQHYLQI